MQISKDVNQTYANKQDLLDASQGDTEGKQGPLKLQQAHPPLKRKKHTCANKRQARPQYSTNITTYKGIHTNNKRAIKAPIKITLPLS